MKKLVTLGAPLLLAIVVPTWLLLKTDYLSGPEFKARYNASIEHAYSSWYLFKVTDDEYCFKYSRPVISKDYCVPTSDLVVRNTKNGEAGIGFVTSRQLFLKNPGKTPGEQPFSTGF